MSSLSDPDEGPNWAELAPNLREQEEAVAAVARQVRIMFAAGKDVAEVSAWLQQIGLPAGEADAFLAALLQAERQASQGELVVTSGPWDFGGVFAPREDPFAKRRESKLRREQSKRLAEAEPDPAFDLGGAAYAQAIAAEARRREHGARLFNLIAFAAVLLPILLIAAFVILAALGVL